MSHDASCHVRHRARVSSPAHTKFDVRITPHNAMSATGFLLAVALMVALSVAVQVAIILAGAWPCAIFLGLTTLLLVGALITSQARMHRYENVRLEANRLIITRVDRSQVTLEREVHCDRLLIERHEDPEYGLRSVLVKDGRTSLELGRDLSPAERETFLAALLQALSDSRQYPRVERRMLGINPWPTVEAGLRERRR